MPQDLLDLAATPERLRALAEAGVLSPSALEQALQLAVESPPKSWWRRFTSIVLMGLGALLVLSGIIYFFAYNWADLHRFGKLGLIMFAIAASAVAAWRLGEGLAGQFALLFAAVLVGPLLAVFGQTYQTGADPYELFLGWSALILPWVVLARFGPLWLLQLGLANVGLTLFWDQALPWRGDQAAATLGLVLGLLNGAAWAAHEVLAHRGARWLQGRWLPRVLSMMTLAPLLAVVVWMTVDPRDTTPVHVACLLLLVAFVAGTYSFHRAVQSELFFLTLDALGFMVVFSTFIARLLFDHNRGSDDWMGDFFLMGLLITTQLGLAVWWLRSEARLRGTEDV
ncbi:DUF2157 domain-containing protein [Myxococcaceae bacterium GXIMD 01537]